MRLFNWPLESDGSMSTSWMREELAMHCIRFNGRRNKGAKECKCANYEMHFVCMGIFWNRGVISFVFIDSLYWTKEFILSRKTSPQTNQTHQYQFNILSDLIESFRMRWKKESETFTSLLFCFCFCCPLLSGNDVNWFAAYRNDRPPRSREIFIWFIHVNWECKRLNWDIMAQYTTNFVKSIDKKMTLKQMIKSQ